MEKLFSVHVCLLRQNSKTIALCVYTSAHEVGEKRSCESCTDVRRLVFQVQQALVHVGALLYNTPHFGVISALCQACFSVGCEATC